MFVEPYVNPSDPKEVEMMYHQSVTDVFEEKIPLTKSDAVSIAIDRTRQIQIIL